MVSISNLFLKALTYTLLFWKQLFLLVRNETLVSFSYLQSLNFIQIHMRHNFKISLYTSHKYFQRLDLYYNMFTSWRYDGWKWHMWASFNVAITVNRWLVFMFSTDLRCPRIYRICIDFVYNTSMYTSGNFPMATFCPSWFILSEVLSSSGPILRNPRRQKEVVQTMEYRFTVI